MKCNTFKDFANEVTSACSVTESVSHVHTILLTIGDVSMYVPIDEKSIAIILDGIERSLEQGGE